MSRKIPLPTSLLTHPQPLTSQQPKLNAPTFDPKDKSYSYFGGDFKTWALPSTTPGSFTSRQLFKAGSPHTVRVEIWHL